MALFRDDFKRLTRVRRREARSLLRARLYDGSYHMAGFAVECALKACIAKQTARHQFPDKEFANQSYIHVLHKLVPLAGLKTELDKAVAGSAIFKANWSIVAGWNPEGRYALAVSRQKARDMYSAIAARKHGVLQWIRAHW